VRVIPATYLLQKTAKRRDTGYECGSLKTRNRTKYTPNPGGTQVLIIGGLRHRTVQRLHAVLTVVLSYRTRREDDDDDDNNKNTFPLLLTLNNTCGIF